MSKYKFSVGQKVMYKGVSQEIKHREKIAPHWAFGNYYHLGVTFWNWKIAPESELTAIKEKKWSQYII